MTTIENLYYGNIVPAEKGIKEGSEYSKLLNLAARNEEKLSATLTKEQKILFEKYKECCIDMYGIAKALVDNGFDGYVRPDHGRMIWGEKGRYGYGLFDRALGATYIAGIFEAIERSK